MGHRITVLLSLVAATTCLVLGGCGKPGYSKIKGRWAWVGSNASVGRYEIQFEADTESFVVLDDPNYGKDRSRVFYEGRLILNADPDSFVILPTEVGWFGQCYAKDKQHVFLQGHLVTGADPNSFEIIDAPYARDEKRVYCGTVPMEGSDPTTFRQMRGCTRWATWCNKEEFIRLFGPRFADLEISESRPAITSWGRWAKDAKHHYRDAAVVEDADYETFHAIDDILGADKNHQYVGPIRKEDSDRQARLRAEAAKVKAEEYRRQRESHIE